MQLSALELAAVLTELDLVGAKIEKIYQQPKPDDIFLITMHKPGVGKIYLYIELPSLLCQVGFKPPFPDMPPHCARALRQHMINARVQSFEQVGFERIIKMTVSTRDGDRHLYIELFPPGNLVLTDDEGRILVTLYHKTWSERRDIRPGKIYALPEKQTDPRTLSLEDFQVLLAESEQGMVVKSLASECSLGGVYAEEVAARAKVDKETPPSELSADGIERLYRCLQELLRAKTDAVRVGENIYPFRLETKEDGERVESYNEAISKVQLSQAEAEERQEFKKNVNKTADKYEKIINAQQQQLKGLARQEELSQSQAELIYAQYTELTTLLYQLKKDAASLSREELKAKYEGLDFVKRIDIQNRTITLEVPDEAS